MVETINRSVANFSGRNLPEYQPLARSCAHLVEAVQYRAPCAIPSRWKKCNLRGTTERAVHEIEGPESCTSDNKNKDVGTCSIARVLDFVSIDHAKYLAVELTLRQVSRGT